MGCSCCGPKAPPKAADGSCFLDADRVAYVSDVEGHWDYFCEYAGLSRSLRFCRGGDHRQARTAEELELELEEGFHFVFGGDACDKGPGTLRFLEAMVGLKRKYPDRVHLLLGNRDINKMRWTSELAQSEIDRVREVPGAYWVPERCRTAPWQYLQRLAAQEEGIPEDQVTDEMIRQRNTKANKLRYMLANDMGSDGEFEFRRQELAHLRRMDAAQVLDEDVVQSYEDSLKPGGCMREYLRLGQLSVLLGKSLFVHGQIVGNQFAPGQVRGADEHGVAWCVGVVPDEEKRVGDLQEWVGRLNAWGRRQISEWEAQPTWKRPPNEPVYEDWRDRGASELICYGTPASRVPTVVYCRFLTDQCMPLQYPPELVEYLKRNGVQNVVVGHTPHGNAPTVIQNDGVNVIMGDTSFSHMQANLHFRGDNRGTAVSDIVLSGSSCSIQGFTEKHEFFEYAVGSSEVGADPFVGLVQCGEHLEKKFFVKAKLPQRQGSADAAYLMSHIKGFGYEYVVLDSDQVRGALSGEPVVDSRTSEQEQRREEQPPQLPLEKEQQPVPLKEHDEFPQRTARSPVDGAVVTVDGALVTGASSPTLGTNPGTNPEEAEAACGLQQPLARTFTWPRVAAAARAAVRGPLLDELPLPGEARCASLEW